MTVAVGEEVLHTHAAVRLEPPGEPQGPWFVHELSSRRRFAASPLTCLVIIAYSGGSSRSEALSGVGACSGATELQFDGTVRRLRDIGLLVNPADDSHQFALRVLEQWTHYGWREAADYHLATFGYPFLDYAGDGLDCDTHRMRVYIDAQPDINRTKQYDGALERVAVPSAAAALDEISTPFDATWKDSVPLCPLDGPRLRTLLATVFGCLRTRAMADNTEAVANLIRKTSPSGGSRHPTEAYLFAHDVPGIEAGIYHFAVRDDALERIGPIPTNDQLRRLLYGLRRAPFRPRAYIVFSSLFERNMYRYREPRTFRTIFMDIGHACATLQIAARSLGVLCHSHHAIDELSLNAMLQLDGLGEGALYAAALGGKDDMYAGTTH